MGFFLISGMRLPHYARENLTPRQLCRRVEISVHADRLDERVRDQLKQ
ncbi:MAG: hypothetical protein E7A35_16710 [Leclercia adecarboxylata]|nr:hypothetical protein [Leclercia adecarboxylata]